MATRAVYEFYGKNDQRILSVYIHWDGYPDGAAMYFKKALDQTPDYLETSDEFEREICGNKFMTNFIRDNKSSEITSGSEIHSDLEYIYKINIFSKQITTVKLNWDKVEASDKFRYEVEDQSEFWDIDEMCSISDFLEKHNELIKIYESRKAKEDEANLQRNTKHS